MTVATFIEWWERLTPSERRLRIAQTRKRQATWRTRRARVLFGVLESDSIFGTLDTCSLSATLLPFVVRGFNADEVLGRFATRKNAETFASAYINEQGGVLTVGEEKS